MERASSFIDDCLSTLSLLSRYIIPIPEGGLTRTNTVSSHHCPFFFSFMWREGGGVQFHFPIQKSSRTRSCNRQTGRTQRHRAPAATPTGLASWRRNTREDGCRADSKAGQRQERHASLCVYLRIKQQRPSNARGSRNKTNTPRAIDKLSPAATARRGQALALPPYQFV